MNVRADHAALTTSLRVLEGPGSVGDDWRRFLRLLWRMTKTEWALRYQEPLVLGYLWTLLGPLLYSLVLYFAFSRVLRFGGEIEYYQAVLILDIMIFQAWSDGMRGALASSVQRGNLLSQLDLPRLVLPLAALLTSIVTLAGNLIVVLGLVLVLGVEPTLTWLLLPVAIVGLMVFAVPLGTLLCALNSRFRDVGEAWVAAARAMFFASPVIIPIESYPESWSGVLQWNPLAVVLAQARVWVIDPSAPSWGDAVGGWGYIVCPIGVCLVIAVLAVLAFRGQVGKMAEQL